MISAHYMREIQKDNERRIEEANKFKHYYSKDKGEKLTKSRIIPRLLNSVGGTLIKIGNTLQAFSSYRQIEI